MKKKIAIFTFNGELMCFAHALLNAIDLHEKGHEVKLIIEGSSTQLLPQLHNPDKPFSKQYQKCRDLGLLDGVCKACANKMGTLEFAQEHDLPVIGNMSGHPAMEDYIADGYEIISM